MKRKPSQPSIKGPSDRFTGEVWLDVIAKGEGDSTVSVTAVHFAPGARTAWHKHQNGQHLHVTQGKGLVQTRGEEVETLTIGDTVYASDGEWHWHGATADQTMSHLSITDGEATWGEHVADEDGKVTPLAP